DETNCHDFPSCLWSFSEVAGWVNNGFQLCCVADRKNDCSIKAVRTHKSDLLRRLRRRATATPEMVSTKSRQAALMTHSPYRARCDRLVPSNSRANFVHLKILRFGNGALLTQAGNRNQLVCC